MNEHVNGWLMAYYDGELGEHRTKSVEAHLESCASCRAELAKLGALRKMLQEIPEAQELMNPQQFISRVGLLLPDRPNRPTWRRWLSALWRSIPIMLLLAWAFLQALLILVSLEGIALDLGLGSAMPNGLSSISQPSAIHLLPLSLGISALIGLTLLSWVASWWIRRQSGDSLRATE
jgi:predicted anti-sigma-YlaC factor YlaD